MTTRWYPAIVERGDTPGFSVFFPDLPGCVSAGDDLQDAANGAAEALELHIRGMIEDDEVLPDPSPIDRLTVDPEVQEAARVWVPVELPGKAIRVNISMDEGLISRIDRAASRLGMTRSGLLAFGARKVLDEDDKVA